MPRKARNLSETGWAHIILRGNNRENLFYDKEDFDRFFTTVKRYQKEFDFQLAILCQMDNHVHFLLRDANGSYGDIIRKITVSYAHYFNEKYDRVGHVFQDRFRSEAVNDETYFLTVLRYIFQNPQKAGICPAAEYPYTFLPSNETVSSLFRTKDALNRFLNAPVSEDCLESDSGKKMKDAQALSLVQELSGSNNPLDLQKVECGMRRQILRDLKQKGGSVRQLSRLTGISRNIIQRA